MSLNDFNKRARLDISLTISGSGEFNPFTSNGEPMNWTLDGDVKSTEPEINLTVKQETCRRFTNKEFRFFGGQTSVGNTSGTIQIGQIAPANFDLLPADVVLNNPNYQTIESKGIWKVNSDPELSSGALANGILAGNVYYTVGQPTDAKIDDPILLDPEIDGIKRVYPGDYMYKGGTLSGTPKWVLVPQYRFPKPDRTFYWVPNTAPEIKSGGKVNDVLAKPGTIMLPVAEYFTNDRSKFIDDLYYFPKGQGLYFDGQKWSSLTGSTFVYEVKNKPPEFWQQTDFRSFDRYEFYLDRKAYDKCFIETYQKIDDSKLVKFTSTPTSGDPENVDFYFRWYSAIGEEDGIQPSIYPGLIYDFSDAYSKYNLELVNWGKARKIFIRSAGFYLDNRDPDPEKARRLDLAVEDFTDGNVTKIVTKYTDYDGNVLTNTITITTQITASMA